MKVDGRVAVELAGPLARNDQLRGMKNGSVLPVRVLEWRTDRSAIVDIKGNVVQLEFDRAINRRSVLELRVEGFRGDRIVFTLADAVRDSGAEFLRGTFPPVFVNALSARLVSGGMFAQLIASLFPGTTGARMTGMRDSLSPFLHNKSVAAKLGTGVALLAGERLPFLHVLSMILNKDNEQKLAGDSFEGFASTLSDEELQVLYDMLPGLTGDPAWCVLPDGEGHELWLCADEEYFLASFELQDFGSSLIVGTSSKVTEVLLVVSRLPEQEFPSKLHEHMRQIMPESIVRVRLAAELGEILSSERETGVSLIDRKV